MFEEYADFCYRQIGGYVLDYIDLFQSLKPKLDKADADISLPEYVSAAVFSTLVGAVSSFFLFSMIFILSSGITGFFYGLFTGMVVGAMVFLGFYMYPSIMIRSRRSKIRDSLPFATLYMSTLAGTGTEVPEIFSSLAERDEYGEVAAESARISQDVETFVTDITEALKKAAERTPSEDFRELMWGMNHVITSGGDLRTFLQERSDQLMNDYKRRVEEFAQQLGLLVEMYITLVIVGSIIFTSMSVVMSTFTGFSGNLIVMIQVGAIFVGLPVISGMFILLIKGITPGGVD